MKPIRSLTMLAFDRARLLDIAGPMQVFSSANHLLGEVRYELSIVSEDGKPVTTDTGIQLLADARIAKFPVTHIY